MMSRIFMIVGSAVLFVRSPCDKAAAASAEVAKKCEAAVVAAHRACHRTRQREA